LPNDWLDKQQVLDYFTMGKITKADRQDIDSIVGLLNLTYRSKDSFRGWTSEADLIEGAVRTDVSIITDLLNDPNSVFLKYSDPDGTLTGCIHLRKNGQALYLGMLSVIPEKQGAGIGKRLLQAAEKHANDVDCKSIYMQVLSHRPELTGWYLRHGYRPTGERKPFNVDKKYGVPVKPLEFFILEKQLSPA